LQPVIRSTNGATKLRERLRTDAASKRLSKRYKRQRIRLRRYRTQEVAGSNKAAALPAAVICLLVAIA
jgi:hypothetical protein